MPCPACVVLFSPIDSSSSLCGCSSGGANCGTPTSHFLALAFRRARVLRPFFLTAWVFLPDHWHAICAAVYPLTIFVVMKSTCQDELDDMVNRRREASGELWQERFFRPGMHKILAALCPADGEGVQREGGVHSLEPGKSRAGAEIRGLAMVQRERILRRDSGGTRTMLWIDD